MMPNYRQHTVYLGLTALLFALFAVCSRRTAFHKRRKNDPPENDDRVSGEQQLADMPFWCVVWLFCLVLAFGRYTPFYRLFYAFPYMQYIRAPVKFLHLVELATACLTGFGMHLFLQNENKIMPRRLVGVSLGFLAALVMGSLVATVLKSGMATHIAALGMGQVAETLAGYTVRNFGRALLVGGVAAGLAGIAWWCGGSPWRVRVGWLFALLLVMDHATVARRYVRAMDLTPFYREHVVVKAVRRHAGDGVATTINYVTPHVVGQDWFSSSLAFNGVRNLAPSNAQDQPLVKLFSVLQADPLRLWRVLQTQTVMLPYKDAVALRRAGQARSLLDFELDGSVVRRVRQPGERTFSLLAVNDKQRHDVRFLTDWEDDVSPDEQPQHLKTSTQVVSDAPKMALPQPSGARPEAHVKTISRLGLPGTFSTRVKVVSALPGLLVFQERKRDDLEVLINGKPALIYTADALWPATVVPAGEHEVVLRRKRRAAHWFASFFLTGGLLFWMLVHACRSARPTRDGVVA